MLKAMEDAELRQTFRARNDAELTGVGLIRRAQPLADAFRGRLPLIRELNDISEHFGVEIAQTVFKLSVEAAPSYGAFIRRIRSFDSRGFSARENSRTPFEVTIVASALPLKSRSAREEFAQVERWAAWARALGFTTDVIEADPNASLRENAQAMSTHLISNPHPNRILVTVGRGAAEFRTLLAMRMGLRGVDPLTDDAAELASVKVWINIAGAYNGASLARLQNESRWARLKLEFSKYLGLTSVALRARLWRQLDPRLPAWRAAPNFPRHLQVINVVGVPLRSEIPVGLMASHERLARQLGPNDGAVGLFEAIAHPGLIVPVDGLSQRADDLTLKPVLERIWAIVASEAVAEIGEADLEPKLELDL